MASISKQGQGKQKEVQQQVVQRSWNCNSMGFPDPFWPTRCDIKGNINATLKKHNYLDG